MKPKSERPEKIKRVDGKFDDGFNTCHDEHTKWIEGVDIDKVIEEYEARIDEIKINMTADSERLNKIRIQELTKTLGELKK